MEILKGNIPTHNRTGWSSIRADEYSAEFIAFSAACVDPVLDIGAGGGCATLGSLASGATVIANDIDEQSLDRIAATVTPGERNGLTLLHGRFPAFDLPSMSLGAINAARVLHFLTGAEIEVGVKKMYKWLVSGGRVFMLATTPWCSNVIAFLKNYESRKGRERWPGEMHGIHAQVTHSTVEYLPDFIHSLDGDVLRGTFEHSGFIVEKLEIFRRKDCPPEIFYDGRENIGLVARKP